MLLVAAAETVVHPDVVPGAPAPESLATDPLRVTVVEAENGFTVRSASGIPLRGGAAWVFRWGRKTGDTRYIHDPDYYGSMRDRGLNAVRLIWFDPWQWHHGPAPKYPDGYDHADLDSQEDVDATFAEIDQVIDEASRNGMYVLLNYHNTGGYRDRGAETITYLTRFWSIASKRYSHRTHVLFELVNEPVEWWPENYGDEVLRDLKVVAHMGKGWGAPGMPPKGDKPAGLDWDSWLSSCCRRVSRPRRVLRRKSFRG